MDTPFSATQWEPTKILEEWEPSPSNLTVASLIDSLNTQTKAITRFPYDPHCWLKRAKILAQLQYPELTVGDAQKALMLCENLLAVLDKRTCLRLGHRTCFLMTGDENGSEGERARERAEQRATFENLKEEAQKVIHENLDFDPDTKKGRYIRRQYPWLRLEHTMRSDEVIQGLNRDCAESAVAVGGTPCCVVKRFAFGPGVGARDGADTLGVFATRRISKDEDILLEESMTWGCNGRNGDEMHVPPNPFSPFEDLPDELLWVREKTGKFAASIVLKCRILICAIGDGAQHPLDHPTLARLTPTYTNKHRKFDLERDIEIFNRVLQQYGIDIFANLNWDTWTFFIMAARVSNNSWSTPATETINTLFAMFNHSCIGNVDWNGQSDHRTMIMTASVDIESGQQLLICYDPFMENQPLEARRERFWKWINGPCHCDLCLMEEEESSSDGSRSMSISSGSWDTDEKPVFPEDLFDFVNENGLVEPDD